MQEIYDALLFDEYSTKFIISSEFCKPTESQIYLPKLHRPGNVETRAYMLATIAKINNVGFDIEFGKGYTGKEDLGKKLADAKIDITPDYFNKYMSLKTPNLFADYYVEQGEIKISRIEKHAILPSQNFCSRTLRTLISLTPGVKSILYDFVTNKKTRDVVQPVLDNTQQLEFLYANCHNSALIRSLIENGFKKIKVVQMELDRFSLRAFIGDNVEWSLPDPGSGSDLTRC